MEQKGPEFETLQKVQRDINCLLENDRTVRRNAVIALKSKLLSADTNKDHVKIIFEQHLLKNLVFVICDEADFVREKAIKLTEEMVSKYEPISVDSIARLIEVLLGRLNAIPYPETSEEVRLAIIQQLKLLLSKYPDAFKAVSSSLADVLAKALLDKFPDVKKEGAELVSLFCKQLPMHAGLNAKGIVKSIGANAKHQHAKVRKSQVEALTDILTVQHGGEAFPEAEPSIKLLISDKSTDVRKEVYVLLGQCLKLFSYPDLKNHEAKLVRYLLNGYSETSPELRELTATLLNECGEARHNLEERMKVLHSS